MEHPCWVKIAQNLSNTPLHISIHYHSAPVVAMRSLSVSGCETIENLPLSASYHHHPSWLESWCSSLSSYSKWSHDFKEICITHTHTLLDPSHPIALLAWLSASIKDLVPGLAAALAAENPKSEFAMLNSTCSTCSTCSTAQGLLEYFWLVRMTKLHNRAICVTLFKTMPALEKQNK